MPAKPSIIARRRGACLSAGSPFTLPGVSLFKSASLVSLLTLASRITGLVRELLMASTFGASALTDAFNVAFRIPNLLRRLFAEGAFSQAFVPVLAAAREKDGSGPIQAFLSRMAKKHKIWLIGGSVPLEADAANKVRNSCLVYDERGKQVARYDKIHLFAFSRGAERYNEARTICAGRAVGRTAPGAELHAEPAGLDLPLDHAGGRIPWPGRLMHGMSR